LKPDEHRTETYTASGFLVRDTEPADLIHGIRVDALLSPVITRRLITEFIARSPAVAPAPGLETLTSRERGAGGRGAGRSRPQQR
jgi:hypothetical protein